MKITLTLEIEAEKPGILTRLSWARRKAQVKKCDEATCQYCGQHAPDGWPDHIIPLSRGGTDALDNLAWACKSCNMAKGDRTLGEWEPPKPWWISSIDDLGDGWLPELEEFDDGEVGHEP